VKLNDPELVREQYASEAGLQARRSIYENAEGPDPRAIAFAAIAEARPRRVLEVGGGPGELAERIAVELGAAVVMVDSSPRMVELARGRGADARVGDAQELPFEDESFDCAVAAWMLYHVPDPDRAIGELARVLEPGGRLVAVTNGGDHLAELRDVATAPRFESAFSRENGADLLERHFASIERRDADGWVTFPDEETIRGYIASMVLKGQPAEPLEVATPLRVRRSSSIFVATT
jgi:SAM-dependent methyltransferase